MAKTSWVEICVSDFAENPFSEYLPLILQPKSRAGLLLQNPLRRQVSVPLSTRNIPSKVCKPQLLTPVDADFFLTSITENFSWIGHSSGSCFLRPGAHFIFILIKAVAAKDIPPSKGSWARFHATL